MSYGKYWRHFRNLPSDAFNWRLMLGRCQKAKLLLLGGCCISYYLLQENAFHLLLILNYITRQCIWWEWKVKILFLFFLVKIHYSCNSFYTKYLFNVATACLPIYDQGYFSCFSIPKNLTITRRNEYNFSNLGVINEQKM